MVNDLTDKKEQKLSTAVDSLKRTTLFQHFRCVTTPHQIT